MRGYGSPGETGLTHSFYGPEYDEKDIRLALEAARIPIKWIEREDELLERTVKALCSGQVIGWFQGRMEFGPRALGARSFLADPRSDKARETINNTIKQRELFRPFAPSVKEERAAEFFEISQTSPFMNLTVPVRSHKRHDIPAVTHINGTARIHTVNKADNRRIGIFWIVLKEKPVFLFC